MSPTDATLSPLAEALLAELSLVEHEEAHLVEGRTAEVEAALEELRAARLLEGVGTLRVTDRGWLKAGTPAPRHPAPSATWSR